MHVNELGEFDPLLRQVLTRSPTGELDGQTISSFETTRGVYDPDDDYYKKPSLYVVMTEEQRRTSKAVKER
ncbi:unnamed protein product [Linum trigynum]|uniref:Uncharacterized protein n=1 Tax=Linum trigynum TaxID=586398 RepID=A0AAV2F9N3_9ROSI